MTKLEKPLALGLTVSFGKIMKTLNYKIHWQGNVSFWTQLYN